MGFMGTFGPLGHSFMEQKGSENRKNRQCAVVGGIQFQTVEQHSIERVAAALVAHVDRILGGFGNGRAPTTIEQYQTKIGLCGGAFAFGAS